MSCTETVALVMFASFITGSGFTMGLYWLVFYSQQRSLQKFREDVEGPR